MNIINNMNCDILFYFFSSRDDSSVVCQKLQCRSGDIECLLNETKSIQWQFVSLPSVSYLKEPVTLVHVQTIGYSVYPNLHFQIISGNELSNFRVEKSNVRGDRGENNYHSAMSFATKKVQFIVSNLTKFRHLSNFHPLKVMDRYHDPQLQMGEN